MEPEFVILEAFDSDPKEGSPNNFSLIFKVEWTDSKQIAYIHFDMIKRRYPQILLDYLIKRIKPRPILQHKEDTAKNQQQKTDNKGGNKGKSPVTEGDDYKIEEPIDPVKQYLAKKVDKPAGGILDYDADVPIDRNIAIPVHLEYQKPHPKRKTVKVKKGSFRH